VLSAILFAFGGFNGWFLWRNLRHRSRSLQPTRDAVDG
jgi:HAMP domain-containing protein